jgi:hypothetical protein
MSISDGFTIGQENKTLHQQTVRLILRTIYAQDILPPKICNTPRS